MSPEARKTKIAQRSNKIPPSKPKPKARRAAKPKAAPPTTKPWKDAVSPFARTMLSQQSIIAEYSSRNMGKMLRRMGVDSASETMDEIFGKGYMAATASQRGLIDTQPGRVLRPRPRRTEAAPEPRPIVEAVHLAPSHTKRAYDLKSSRSIVEKALVVLGRIGNVDAIMACGHSGLPLAGAISFLANIPLIAVRKDGEYQVAGGSPQVSTVLHGGPAKRWVWFDDFCSSGGTLSRCIAKSKQLDAIATCLPTALLLYQIYESDTTQEHDLSSYFIKGLPCDDTRCAMYGLRT